jgi:(1->4)-alpha-D-glucan 1-alpha-D-glucosylmutase
LRSAPRSTYRLQLTPAFGFDAAAAVAPYLAALGVTHVYCSPYLQAAPGSTHGYDVVDHSRVNEELGGAAAHARFLAALDAAGLGQVIDVVPNHMATTPENRWWWDVLENGPASVYASYFDIDWDPPEAKLRSRVLLPVLGDHYGRVLEAGELQVVRAGGGFSVRYHDHAAPLAPRSLDDLLGRAAARCGSAELESLAAALGRLPLATATDRDSVQERHRDKEVLRDRLARLAADEGPVADALDAVVAELNADPDALDTLLARQNYRLAHWHTAGEELAYRRFFDVTGLVALRMEDELVFADTHALVLHWVREGAVHGLRVDHPDGLRDPEGYLRRLAEATGGTWVVVEKILEGEEALPATWPVAGTTGYEFLNQVGGLFVDAAGEQELTALYRELTGDDDDWPTVARTKKREVLSSVLAADLERVTAALMAVCEGRRRHRDYTRSELRAVLAELVAAFPVYRSYVDPVGGKASEADHRSVEVAVAGATGARPDLDAELVAFVADLLLAHVTGPAEAEFVARFQQLTGPVMAKGVEDTAFYTYTRFVARNEVGGDPGQLATDPGRFHAANAEALTAAPARMTTTATHDTKRGEDVRARLALLSQIPGPWADAVRRWRASNNRHRAGDWPDANTEYLMYQTLVGAWPLPLDRATAYMEKAVREAKVHTSWVAPNEGFESALRRFVESVLADGGFTADLEAFVAPLVWPGRVTAMAQTLIKLTAPGVPDTYQGTELWDLSLVDPDNRRPVDFEARSEALARLDRLRVEDVVAVAESGLPKVLVTTRALQLRRSRPEALGPGAYRPLEIDDDHWLGFERGGSVAVVVPRFALRTGRPGATVALAAGAWRNVLTGDVVNGGRVPAETLVARFPVALLERA